MLYCFYTDKGRRRSLINSIVKSYSCIYCGKESTWSHQKDNKYCSNTCQALYQSDLKLKNWLNGKISFPKGAIKRHLLKVQNNCCAICSIPNNWNGQALVFVLDHIDGNSENNTPVNLRLVCPNCDSQLPTFKSRNRGNGRHSRKIRYMEGKSF